ERRKAVDFRAAQSSLRDFHLHESAQRGCLPLRFKNVRARNIARLTGAHLGFEPFQEFTAPRFMVQLPRGLPRALADVLADDGESVIRLCQSHSNVREQGLADEK